MLLELGQEHLVADLQELGGAAFVPVRLAQDFLDLGFLYL
jgi:hypothetical protein